MHEPVAYVLAGVFTALAALHFYWAVRGVAGGGVALPTRSSGKPLFLPSRATTMSVVFALLAAAVVVLGRAQLLPPNNIPFLLFVVGAWTLGLVFAARAIGEFQYVGLFKRERSTGFARADTRYFTPLCIVIAIGVFYLAAAPVAP
ncbi:MAG: DUF3995 domain-containing protein [Phycisphaerae bacterium]|nr:DUF3995 domain-containing protein [Gemmatimonadaceae bacterium]